MASSGKIEGRIDIDIAEDPILRVGSPPPTEDKLPGPSGENREQLKGIRLVNDPKTGPSKILYKCALCDRYEKDPANLEGKDDKRSILSSAATEMQDTIVMNNIAENPKGFMYHNQYQSKKRPSPIQCYKNYTRKLEKFKNVPVEEESTPEPEEKNQTARLRKSTRSRSGSSENPSPTLPASTKPKKEHAVCDICCKRAAGSWPNQTYTLIRISEMKLGDSRASKFLSAIRFNEDHLHRKFIYCVSTGDIFAADVLYHRDCMTNYLRQYDRKVQNLLRNIEREEKEMKLEEETVALFDGLELDSKAYKLTEITDILNQSATPGFEFENRKTKVQLIKFFGDTISFSYSKDKSKPQVVFKNSVGVSDIIEGRLRDSDVIRECAKLLESEIKSYSFGLDDSLCLSSDLELSMERYKKERPHNWMTFVKAIFSGSRHKQEEEWLIKFDMIFQFFFRWFTGKTTPLHCGITQSVHCLTKSRELIDIIHRFGFGISYDTMKRIDTAICNYIVDKTGKNRGPVSDDIKSGTPIQCSIDNFNHKERTPTGGGMSNDTVMVVWQNNDDPSCPESPSDREISTRPNLKAKDRKRAFDYSLPCQDLVESRLIKNTAEISEGFSPITNYTHKSSLLDGADEDNFTWYCARNLRRVNDERFTTSIPSQTAVKSKLLSAAKRRPQKTAKSFYPVLPHPATQMDSILTCLINFKDVLSQRGESQGVVWCDEGVYCLAKEIQLLKPEEFGMLFIGLGPFHFSKILMGAVGKWLKASGIGEALVNSGVFTEGAASSSVLQGGDYIKAKDGLNIIAEAITILQHKAYSKSETYSQDKDNLCLEEIQYDMDSVFRDLYDSPDADQFQSSWEMAKVSLQKLRSSFKEFQDSQTGSENFQYWNIFLNKLFPCVRDFETAVRCGNWKLFLSAVERSLVIFFATGKHNYARYGPLFYQDCLDLQRRFPEIYKHFENGNFVCYMSERFGSGIGFDQALEKAYNHTAKASAGVIGFTRRKKAVAMWDLLKHDKDLDVSFVREVGGIKEHVGELDSLHHEFNTKKAKESHQRVKQLVKYIESVSNPFTQNASIKLTNLTTLEAVPNADILLNSLDAGYDNYQSFVQERLAHKVKGLHDTINFKQLQTEDTIQKKQKPVKLSTNEEENNKSMTFIQYATSRGHEIEHLLSFPITSRPTYLLEKDSLNQKKSTKAALTSNLLKALDKSLIMVSEEDEWVPRVKCDAVVVDFMSVVHRHTAVKRSDVTSFGSLCGLLLNSMLSYGKESNSVHVILENYSEMSVKAAERVRRASHAGTTAPVYCQVESEEQRLPSSFEDFCRRTSNKVSFQDFFVKFCIKHYQGSKPLYIAGGDKSDPDKCIKICNGVTEQAKDYRASHEEADDRIMFSIDKIHKSSPQCSVTVISPDADIFVTLIFHLKRTWVGMKLYLLKKGKVNVKAVVRNEIYPLHELVAVLDPQIVDNLPAGHALTGCDSVAKVGTKPSMLKVLQSHGYLIEDFGLDVLDDDMLERAETFLVKIVATKAFEKCSSFDELRTKMYLKLRDKKFIDLPCSTKEIRLNIKRAYYQARMWMESAYGDAREIMNVEDFGYDGSFAPVWFHEPNQPSDVPLPCNCKSCVRRTCPCRERSISCSNYCKCVDNCKNPF